MFFQFESVVMLLFYVVYCVALCFNTELERWALSLNLPFKLPTKEEQSSLVTYKNVQDNNYTQGTQQQTNLSQEPNAASSSENQQQQEYQNYTDPNASWDPNAAWGDTSDPVGVSARSSVQPAAVDDWGMSQYSAGQGQENIAYNPDQPDAVVTQSPTGDNTGKPVVGKPQPTGVEYYKSSEKSKEARPNPLERPTTGGMPALISWYIVYPIHFLCQKTMPDCRTEKYRNWYPFTFLISMVWISFYSYFMVWMITVIGSTLAIPDTVMGLTFVAAGVSVPDALSSIAVIKEGYGDMAVSNAIGSNVFDILVCLGLPWFIQTAIIKPGSHVNVISKGKFLHPQKNKDVFYGRLKDS